MGKIRNSRPVLIQKPNKKFQQKSWGLVTQAFSPITTQAEASASRSFRPAYNEIRSPKQTENYKKLPVEGASGKHVGDTDARPAPTPETELNLTLAHPPLQWGGPGGLLRTPPPRREGRARSAQVRARARTRARALLRARTRGRMRRAKRHCSGHRASRPDWSTAGGKDRSGRAAPSERVSPEGARVHAEGGRGALGSSG